MIQRILSFCVFLSLFSFHVLFSFEEGILADEKWKAEHKAQLIAEVNAVHGELSAAQCRLYSSLVSLTPSPAVPPSSLVSATPKSGGAAAARIKSSTAHSSQSGSVRSERDASQNWQDANFAVGVLILTKEDGSSVVFPVSHACHMEPAKEFVRGATLYDSCYDRTHDQIPNPDLCEAQWMHYLSEDKATRKAEFLGGWDNVKKHITANLSKYGQDIEKVTKDKEGGNYLGAIGGLDDAKTAMENLEKSIATWIRSGWHSEQRWIFDLDNSDTLAQLEKHKEGVTGVIACLHTRLFPCSNAIEVKPGCSCYDCLNRWPTQWKGREIFPNIPIVLTVSFSDYPAEAYNKLAAAHHYHRLNPAGVIDRDLAERWVRTALLKRQINSKKFAARSFAPPPMVRTRLPLEENLYRILLTTFVDLPVSYEETPDLVDCRSFIFKLPGERVIQKFMDTADGTPRLALEIMKGAAIVSSFPVTMKIRSVGADDCFDLIIQTGTDWDLALRLAFMHSCQSEQG